PAPPAGRLAASARRFSTCRTRTWILPGPGTPPRAGSDARPSGRRSGRPPLPPHRVLDPEGHAALEHITLHRQLGVLLAQPGQLRPLILRQGPVRIAAAPLIRVHPVPQGPLVDPEIPGDLRDRLAGLPDQPDRALPEVLIERPACLCHRRPPLRRCVHATRGNPIVVVRLGWLGTSTVASSVPVVCCLWGR